MDSTMSDKLYLCVFAGMFNQALLGVKLFLTHRAVKRYVLQLCKRRQ